jgi:hypothetical protein
MNSNANTEQLAQFVELLKSGRNQQANALLEKIVTKSPDLAGPYALLLGGMLAQSGQYGPTERFAGK